jgi:hypothetical protein
MAVLTRPGACPTAIKLRLRFIRRNINVGSPTDEAYDWFLALEEFLLMLTEERYLRVRNALLLNLTPYGLVSICRIA